jgi:oxazoline/thiazoline synthase
LSEAQHAQGRDRPSRSGEGLRRFDPSAEMEWSPVWSLRDERFKHLPTGLLYFFHDAPGDQGISADTNGCAAGNRVEEAIIHGFLELVERDACAIWWYNRLRRAEIDPDELGDDYLLDLRARYAATGRGLWVLDVTSDLGIPAVVAVAHWQKDARDCVRFAAGAHFDLRIATLRAVTKLNQSLTVDRMTHRPGGQPDEDGDALPAPLRKTAYLLPHARRPSGARGRRDSQASIGASRCWLASSSPGASGSISSCSTRPGPTFRCRLSG